MTKRILLGNNDLWKKTYGVLIDIFCCGILEAENKKIALGSIISILATPTTWPIIIFKKIIHLAILAAFWFFFSSELSNLKEFEILVFAIALLIIFYRDIYKEITELLLFVLIAITSGGFLRWLCNGYLNNALLRQEYLTNPDVEPVIASLVPTLPENYDNEYDSFMQLYFESNKKDGEQLLIESIEKYWNEKNA